MFGDNAGGIASGLAGGVFFFQAEDGIRDIGVTGVQTWCSSDLDPAGEDLAPAPNEPEREDGATGSQRRERGPRPPKADLLSLAKELLGDTARDSQGPRPARRGIYHGNDHRYVGGPSPPPRRCLRSHPTRVGAGRPATVAARAPGAAPVGRGGEAHGKPPAMQRIWFTPGQG